MSEDIAPYNATIQSQRMIDTFPITGKLESYSYHAISCSYKIRLESIGICPKKETTVFFRDKKDFSVILEMMQKNHSTTISKIGKSTDSIEQPDGTYQSLPKTIRVASGVSSFQSEGLERVVFSKKK